AVRKTLLLLLGGEPLDEPAVALAAIAQPVVEPVRAVLPELVALGRDSEAAPVRRPQDVAASRLERCHPRLEARTTLDHLALRRGARADLGAAGTRAEVRLRLGFLDALDGSLDPHLPPEGIPVEEERRAR